MKTAAIIQARMSSERLPGKVLKELNGTSVIECIVKRAMKAKQVDKVIVATSEEASDDVLYEFCLKKDIPVFRGELNDVLKRYYDCATIEQADIVIRLTGDNPLIDAEILDRALSIFRKEKIDYLQYCSELPLGMHVEVFSYEALQKAYAEADDKECREHVTLFLYKNPEKFNCIKYSDNSVEDNSHLRWTIDTEADYKLVKRIYESMAGIYFKYEDVLRLYKEKPELVEINKDIHQKQTSYKEKV